MTDEMDIALAENKRLHQELAVVSKEYFATKKPSQDAVDQIIYRILKQITEWECDDDQPHRDSCSWRPYTNGSNGKKIELVLIISNDFKEAIHNLDEQFKSTQKSIATVTNLTRELKVKIDSIVRNG